MVIENKTHIENTGDEAQNITLGQPLSDFLLQLEDYTPTVRN